MTKLINGAIYKRDIWTFMLVFIPPGKWGMLHFHRGVHPDLTSPMFQHDKNGKFQFNEKELEQIWGSNSWKKLEDHRADIVDGNFLERQLKKDKK